MIRFSYIFFFILLISMYSCEKDITVNVPETPSQLVIEGSIENETPPIIILTKSTPYYGGLNTSDISAYFEHGARILVKSSDGDSVLLVEYCYNDFAQFMTDSQKIQFANRLGFQYDSAQYIPNFCIYSVPDLITYYSTGVSSFMGKAERTYNLTVTKNDKVLTARTTIPKIIRPNFLSIKPHPVSTNDSLVTVMLNISVPPTYGNFIQYWTKRNDESFYKPVSRSVWDDKLFVGQTISLPLERGQSKYETTDFKTFAYFWKGDSVVVKWANIDKATYDFWNTIETDGGDSPFSSPIKIQTNISGGQGIWAGYGVSYLSIKIPK